MELTSKTWLIEMKWRLPISLRRISLICLTVELLTTEGLNYIKIWKIVRKTPFGSSKQSECDTIRWNPGYDGQISRLRFTTDHEWFNPRCGLQVIHLLRDPRAMIRSRLVGHIAEKESRKVCSDMERDLKLAEILPSDRWEHFIIYLFVKTRWRYIRIKYEHLVKDPFETVEMLYAFSGIETTGNIYKILCHKTHGQRQDLKFFYLTKYIDGFLCCSNGFYGTQRGQAFNPNHWQTESTIKEIRTIEENCESLMAVLNYSIYNKKNNG